MSYVTKTFNEVHKAQEKGTYTFSLEKKHIFFVRGFFLKNWRNISSKLADITPFQITALPDIPPCFFRREAPEIFLLRKSLRKNFRPDTPPPFFSEN